MSWYVGIDVGAFSCSAVLTEDDRPVQTVVLRSGTDYAAASKQALDRLLAAAGLDAGALGAVVATGIGAKGVSFAHHVVGEGISSARGIFALDPEVRTLIDVGAQATRVVWLDEAGRIVHFSSNEKCATGSGRFLQVIANVLRVPLADLGPLSLQATKPVSFTTGCAVFGESEAITRVSEGVPKEDIIASVHRTLAEKVAGLMRGRTSTGACAVCGGGALDVGLVHWLERELGRPVRIPEQPQAVGALGAAVQGRREALAA